MERNVGNMPSEFTPKSSSRIYGEEQGEVTNDTLNCPESPIAPPIDEESVKVLICPPIQSDYEEINSQYRPMVIVENIPDMDDFDQPVLDWIQYLKNVHNIDVNIKYLMRVGIVGIDSPYSM